MKSISIAENNPKYDSREDCNAIIETESNTLIFGCQSTKIPLSVTSIGNNAFSKCYALKEISIPSSINSIGNYAFYDCNGLLCVKCYIHEPYEISQNVFGNSSGTFYGSRIEGDMIQEEGLLLSTHDILFSATGCPKLGVRLSGR